MSQISYVLNLVGIDPTPSIARQLEADRVLQNAMTHTATTAKNKVKALVAVASSAEQVAPALEEAINAVVRQDAANAVLTELTSARARGESAAVAEDAAVLWPQLADRFAAQAARLTDAVGIVGIEPDARAIGRMGDTAKNAHAAYLDAYNMIGQLVGAVNAVAAALGQRTPLPLNRYVDPDEIVTAVDLDRIAGCEGGPAFGIAALIDAGYLPQINTPDALAAAVTRVGVAAADPAP